MGVSGAVGFVPGRLMGLGTFLGKSGEKRGVMKEEQLQLADGEIVARVVAGNADAFALLVERYQHYVFRIVNRHVASQFVEETAHDAFVAAYRGLARFSNRGCFKNWLTAIAVRTCHDFWRQRYRSPEIAVSALGEEHLDWLERALSSSAEERAGLAEQIEARDLLQWLLGKLSAGDRMVVELIHIEGYSCVETAALLGLSVANVKIRSHRARKKLQGVLDELTNA